MRNCHVMLSAALILGMVLAGCYVPSAQGDRSRLGGDYVVNGFDPDGIEYGGVLTVEPGETAGEYVLHWVVTGAVQEGHGRLSGDLLEVEWEMLDGFEVQARGTATYRLRDDGSLVGTRTVEGSSGTGTEEAFPDI